MPAISENAIFRWLDSVTLQEYDLPAIITKVNANGTVGAFVFGRGGGHPSGETDYYVSDKPYNDPPGTGEVGPGQPLLGEIVWLHTTTGPLPAFVTDYGFEDHWSGPRTWVNLWVIDRPAETTYRQTNVTYKEQFPVAGEASPRGVTMGLPTPAADNCTFVSNGLSWSLVSCDCAEGHVQPANWESLLPPLPNPAYPQGAVYYLACTVPPPPPGEAPDNCLYQVSNDGLNWLRIQVSCQTGKVPNVKAGHLPALPSATYPPGTLIYSGCVLQSQNA